jgi:hypothetical protein
MYHDFQSLADDYFVNCTLQTTMPLPSSRETILQFGEAVQREFPDMTAFFHRDSGEYVLESDHDRGSYKWLELQTHRLIGGFFNPPSPAEAYRLHEWLLERSMYFLGVSGLDIECLDVMFGFNLDYAGNRDELVAKALLGGSPLGNLSVDGTAIAIEFEPNIVLAMEPECYLQARMALETHSSTYQVRTGHYENEPISIYFTVRQYPGTGKVMQLGESFKRQSQLCEELVSKLVVPNVLQPISSAIASSQ